MRSTRLIRQSMVGRRMGLWNALVLAFKKAPGSLMVMLGLLPFFSAVWGPSVASAHTHTAAITLDTRGHPSNITTKALWWLDNTGKSAINQISSTTTTALFAPNAQETMYSLRPEQRLWAKIDLFRPPSVDGHWMLSVPLPLIDEVALYRPHPTKPGEWTIQRAGDRLSNQAWPERGRYPRFNVDVPEGYSVWYLQIQGSTPISIPIELARQNQGNEDDQRSYLGLGIILGALLLMVLLCFAMGYTYRDKMYVIYGLYAMLLILAISAYTGLAAQFIWNESPVWADAAQGALTLFAGGTALFFINSILSVEHYAARTAWLLRALGTLGPVLALVYTMVDRYTGVMILALYVANITLVGQYASLAAWKRGDTVARWVFFAYLPLALAVLAAVMRAIGWISISWVVQYGVVIAMLIEVPMLMIALNIRSRERHAAQTREEALPTQDALTGLLTEHLFQDRLQQAVARSRRYGEDAAVVVVSLVNHRQITAIHGSTMAEQSLLRSVIMLRRLLRDVDTAARIGPSQFGLILEGVKSKDQVTQLGARLISLGLMPLKGFTPEVTLQFQFAGVLLREFTEDVALLQPRLLDLLTGISPRSRRPIRFLQPTPTDAAPLAPNTPAPPVGKKPVLLQTDPPARYVEPDSDLMPSDGDDSGRSSGHPSR